MSGTDDAPEVAVAATPKPTGGTTTIEKVREAVDYYSSTASSVTRQLAFAGIGVVWIVRVGGDDAAGLKWDDGLLFPLAVLVLALLFDLLHYSIAAYRWNKFHDEAEHGNHGEHTALSAPRKINKLNTFFFYSKIVLVVVAFAVILFQLGQDVLAGDGKTAGSKGGTPATANAPGAASVPAASGLGTATQPKVVGTTQ